LTKEWTELGISNDFLFGKIMRDPELCQELLEVILNVPIARVEYPEEQKTIDISQDARSVRLDVYVADGNNTVYDIEMQTVHEKDLPKRSRYYQGMIDLSLIEKGEPYNKLNSCTPHSRYFSDELGVQIFLPKPEHMFTFCYAYGKI